MPSQPDLDRLRSIKTLPSLIAYLRDELDWPIEADETEDVTFDYDPEELGFDTADAVHIKEIKQLRPLAANQPWGIFWVNLEKKRLPVVMLRRILANLVLKKRATANKASQRAWHLNDLLFISAYGEETDRAITFAHFSQDAESPGDLPVLKVLGWDDGDTVLHLADAHRTLAEKLRWPAPPANVDAWRSQWGGAFTLRHREVITTTTELVEELARLADATRRRARTILARESERGPLRRLYAAFKTALIHDLTQDDFADVIAQTISYGLLIARFSRAAISAQNLVDMVPATNPFLRELLGTFLALAGRQKAFDFDELGIQDVVEVLNRANADAVKADFGNKTQGEDPVIHFYEHFLAAYDRQKKIQRGVFYTPQPVVSYIVRSIHELLQKEFGIEDGLASTITWDDMLKTHPDLKLPKIRMPKLGKAEGEEVDLRLDEFFVMILDIATGTGTFMVETIEVIFLHLQAKWAKHGLQGMPIIRHSALRIPTFKDYWNAYVPAALLPRLYGFELMMAPYTIAHMKLALKLSEINARLGQADYLFKFEGRAHIYLTNTLEPPSGFQTQEFAKFFPALAHEAAAVNEVKRTKCYTVAMGNPPYSLVSANMGPEHRALVERFKFIGVERIRERGALQLEKILNDDYVKFIARAEDYLTTTGVGLLGLITNHAYLDNPTMRGLRHNLMASFKQAFLYDLGGSAKKIGAEVDENVFDIQQGVAIGLFIRDGKEAEVRHQHARLLGTREEKYRVLRTSSSSGTEWNPLSPTPPFYLFVPTDYDLRSEYEQFLPLADVFTLKSIGLFTSKDSLVIDWTPEAVEQKVRAFQQSKLSNKELCDEVGITAKAAWNVTKSRERLGGIRSLRQHIVRFLHRPFDSKYLFYERSLIWSMAWPVNRNLIAKGNLALTVSRQLAAPPWNHVFCSNTIVELCYITNKTKEGNHVFPLYVLPDEDDEQGSLAGHDSRRPSFHPVFLRKLVATYGLRDGGHDGLPAELTPEDIFYYIYAVFHSPGYRSRYAEFLKIDFPCLPLTGNLELFRALARLGGELVALHLLETPNQSITEFIGGRNPEVEKVSWSKNTVWLDKAQSTGFKGVREDVWNFHIGCYQVCEKWLKDRKGRNLSADDRAHYQKIVAALSETIRLMQEIDQVIAKHGGWPLK